MEESAFNALADAELARIEAALENCGADLDIEPKPGGVLEIEFDNGTKMITGQITQLSGNSLRMIPDKGNPFTVNYRLSGNNGLWLNGRLYDTFDAPL